MAWLELHQSVRDHRKIVEVADLLDMPEPHVVGHLSYLWLWAIDNAPDGVLPTSSRVIARAAWWTGDANQFLDALIAAGLIDRDGDAHVIHDWVAYTGKLIGQRKAHAERQKRYRQREEPARDEHVPSTSPAHADSHNRTEQDPTEQDQGGPSPLPPSPVVEDPPVPADGSNPADPGGNAPPTNQPFDLLDALCETLGQDVSVLGKHQKNRQLAVAKRLIDDAGMSADDVARMTRWLKAQDWLTGGLDMFTLEKQVSKWQLAGKPDETAAVSRASPLRRMPANTPASNADHNAAVAEAVKARLRGDTPAPPSDDFIDTTARITR